MVLGLPHFRTPSYNWVTVLEDTWSHLPIIGLICFYIYTVYTLWLFNIAMENGPFMDDCPTKTSIYKGFSIAMLNYQRVYIYIYSIYIQYICTYVYYTCICIYIYIYISPWWVRSSARPKRPRWPPLWAAWESHRSPAETPQWWPSSVPLLLNTSDGGWASHPP